MNKIKVYYHNDLDGMFSAILYGKLLTDNQQAKTRFEFQPINYDYTDWQDSCIRESPEEYIVILDFMYHPQADLWIDHHLSGLGKFATSGQVQSFWNPSAPSCTQVIFDMVGRSKFIDEEVIKKVVEEINIVDSALYTSVNQIYNPTSFGPIMRMAMSFQCTEEFMNETIKTFIYNRTAIYRLFDGHLPWSVEWRYSKYKFLVEEGYKVFQTVCQIEDNITFFIAPPYVKTDRYFPFRLHPESDYTVYIKDYTWSNHGCFISLSKNPLKQQSLKSRVNLKEIAESFGGGGHTDVAGIFIKEGLEQAITIQNLIIQKIKECTNGQRCLDSVSVS